MSRPLDVVVHGEAPVDIVTTSAGAAERPGGSPTDEPPGVAPSTREDPQRSAAPKESA